MPENENKPKHKMSEEEIEFWEGLMSLCEDEEDRTNCYTEKSVR